MEIKDEINKFDNELGKRRITKDRNGKFFDIFFIFNIIIINLYLVKNISIDLLSSECTTVS
jgi:hypothetical protein